MSQSGILSAITSGGPVVETITGNAGGPVGPDAGFNINIVGNNSSGINIVGNPGTNTLTVTAFQATTAQEGTVTLATNAQAIAGTDTANALTSSNLAAKLGTQTAHSLAVFEGSTSALTALGAATNGQIPIGSTGADPVLGSITSTGGTITVTGGPGTINLDVAASSHVIETITGNSGGAESPLAGNFNILGTGSITVAGSANTETVQLTGLTNHAIQIGAGTATLTQLGSGTTGQVLQTNTGADPTWSTATYPSTTTINQLLYSSSANVVGGLATANKAVLTTGATGIPVLTALATDGQLIIGSTAGVPAAATLTAGSGVTITNAGNSITISATGSGGVITTINGDTGSITGATVTIKAGTSTQNSGSSVTFTNSGTTSTLNVTDSSSNTFIGNLAGNATLSGSDNVGYGSSSLHALTSGFLNTMGGVSSAFQLTSGSNNTGWGNLVFENLDSGTYNTGIGAGAGSAFLSTESNNIVIGSNGVAADSNTIRIGNQGSGANQQNLCFIAGIEGVSVSNLNYVTINTATGQLGSTASVASSISITGNSGGALTGNAFTFTGGTTGLTFAGAGTTETLGGTLVVANGGTGNTTFTAYSVICAGTTATGTFQNVSGVGTAGQVLTSNGASALPTWQNGASVLGITTVNHAASPYTVLAADEFLAVTVAGGVVTIKLPNAPTTGRVIYIKDSTGAAATSNISVTTVGGTVTIDGQTTYTMATNYQSLSVVFDGSNYEVF